MAGAAVALALFAAAVVLRLYHVTTSYDVFIDEVTYRQIASNLANGEGLTLYGSPFTLHPPVSFLLMAGALRLLGLDGPAMVDIDALRMVTACVGALVAPATWLLVRRCGAGALVAAGAASFVVVDPFLISFDSRVMLEAWAQVFVVATLLLLVSSVRLTGRTATVTLVLAGLSGAAALATKETFGLVLVATMAMAIVTRVLPRRQTAAALVIALLGYATNAAITSWAYGFSSWWGYRTDGLARLLGHKQSTGFNAETTQVSLTSRVLHDLDVLVVTYGVLIVGGVGTLVLLTRLWRRRHAAVDPRTRLLDLPVLWSLAACGYLAYATLFGSIEEQMYYIPLLPCTIVAFLWASGLGRSVARPVAAVTAAVLVLAPVAFNLVVWERVHTTDVNAYGALVDWAPDHLEVGSKVALTDDTSQFLLDGLVIGDWSNGRDLKSEDVDFVVIQTKLVEEGYSDASPNLLAKLRSKAKVIFEADSTDGAQLLVFDTRAWTGGTR